MGATWVKAAVLAAGVVWGAAGTAEASTLSIGVFGILGDNTLLDETIRFETTTGIGSVSGTRYSYDTNITTAFSEAGLTFKVRTMPFEQFGLPTTWVDIFSDDFGVTFTADDFPFLKNTTLFGFMAFGSFGSSIGSLTISGDLSPVPLPTSSSLFGAALIALGGVTYSRRLKAA